MKSSATYVTFALMCWLILFNSNAGDPLTVFGKSLVSF